MPTKKQPLTTQERERRKFESSVHTVLDMWKKLLRLTDAPITIEVAWDIPFMDKFASIDYSTVADQAHIVILDPAQAPHDKIFRYDISQLVVHELIHYLMRDLEIANNDNTSEERFINHVADCLVSFTY